MKRIFLMLALGLIATNLSWATPLLSVELRGFEDPEVATKYYDSLAQHSAKMNVRILRFQFDPEQPTASHAIWQVEMLRKKDANTALDQMVERLLPLLLEDEIDATVHLNRNSEQASLIVELRPTEIAPRISTTFEPSYGKIIHGFY